LDYEAERYAGAFARFRRLAQRGNLEAAGYVGVMMLRGQGTPADPDSGVYWLRRAAYKRDPHAMTELGSAYQSGEGVGRSLGRAREWYHKAADEKRWAEAMRRLGTSFRDEQDYGAALLWYQNAVMAGSLEARIDAGELYELGRGTPRDLEAARCLYRTAAEAGSLRGMLVMGRISEKGTGVPRDYAGAATWYLKAAEAGSPEGMYALGVLYLDGLGVPRDSAQADTWFERARQAGYRIAGAGAVAPGAN
ncbi:MAG TPA: tetratricopeptide repeat protein, partial [Longimicrobiaceae bacterium]|nr:tetratricopeptide repeat protein [Longimicrobiaceae bacterium]